MLAKIGANRFLKKYWQQRPLLIRQALDDFHDPLSPEELAGLACEDESESRLVYSGNDNWRLREGPFTEQDFATLPQRNWTLLVQAVDHWFPRLKQLFAGLDCIPHWRIDDVMVSYATPGGSVGPHFDYYDVFIVQGRGSRTWRIGQRCDASSRLETGSGLKILADFRERESLRLSAGDVLYIPPGVAHFGTADSESMSYSVGFRAPSLGEIVTGFGDMIHDMATEDRRYRDPDTGTGARAGEIDSAAVNALAALLREELLDRTKLGTWFGRYMTEPKDPDNKSSPPYPLSLRELKLLLRTGGGLEKHPASRFAWLQGDNSIRIFADGEVFIYSSPSPLLMELNAQLSTITALTISATTRFLDDPGSSDLLLQLYNQGSLLKSERNT